MKTKQKILEAVSEVAAFYNAEILWGSEDGITWITIYGDNINPKIFDEVTSKMSQETGVDCYFNKAGINDVKIAFDAKINYIKEDDIPENYEKVHNISSYGTLFK